MRFPFVGASNTNRSVQVSAQRTVNMYVEIDPESKFTTALYSRPGLVRIGTAGASGSRGRAVYENAVYTVTGDTLFRITTANEIASVGQIATDTGRVEMAVNDAVPPQLMLVDGVKGYIWNGTTLSEITAAGFPGVGGGLGPTHVEYIDGYFVVNDPNVKGQFQISGIRDGTSWDAADFARAERNPDALLSVVVNLRELWLVGSATSEVWFNSGNIDFPFEPTQSGFTEWGCAAPYSPQSIDGRVYWLAQSPEGNDIVLQSQGLRGQRISTHAVEEAFSNYDDVSDALGWTMQARGHVFYGLHFPSADATWVYDATSNTWAEWKTYGIGRWGVDRPLFFNGDHYVGDYQDGSIYRIDFDAYSDASQTIERIREDRHVVSASDRRPLTHRILELEMEAGQGSATLDPQAMLQWSDDGGRTFSNEHWRGAGLIGKYNRRLVWRNLGRSEDRIYRVTMTDRVKSSIVSGWLHLR